MKSTRMVTAAVLALGAAFTFTGCATSSTDATTSATDEVCFTEVRNVTNNAVNTLAGDIFTDAAGTSKHFGELVERVEALAGTVDNSAADKAFTAFSASLSSAGDYVATAPVPAEDAEADPGLAAASAAVQDAGTEAAAHCSAS